LTAMSEQLRDPMGGEVRLGIIPTVAPYLLPKILAPLAREFPNLHIQLTEGQTSQITRLLKHGDLDAVLLALPLQEENVEEFELYIEPFLFAAAAGHPKAQNHSVTTDDLQDEEVLLLEDGHCLRDQALAICQAHRGVESNSVSATSLETLRELVSANMGITLMPELAVASLGDRDSAVRYIPFAGEVPSRTLGLCWRSSSTRSGLLADLAQSLSGYLAKK
ncbi:MAG: LysR substrate-binding domain-containing protein, partial [Pseudomonadota bacterium]|nr:LysR substrate-binding domain-containing protein [Pseudomonadota bacterium]